MSTRSLYEACIPSEKTVSHDVSDFVIQSRSYYESFSLDIAENICVESANKDSTRADVSRNV